MPIKFCLLNEKCCWSDDNDLWITEIRYFFTLCQPPFLYPCLLWILLFKFNWCANFNSIWKNFSFSNATNFCFFYIFFPFFLGMEMEIKFQFIANWIDVKRSELRDMPGRRSEKWTNYNSDVINLKPQDAKYI